MNPCYECRNYNHVDCREGKFDRHKNVQHCGCKCPK